MISHRGTNGQHELPEADVGKYSMHACIHKRNRVICHC